LRERGILLGQAGRGKRQGLRPLDPVGSRQNPMGSWRLLGIGARTRWIWRGSRGFGSRTLWVRGESTRSFREPPGSVTKAQGAPADP